MKRSRLLTLLAAACAPGGTGAVALAAEHPDGCGDVSRTAGGPAVVRIDYALGPSCRSVRLVVRRCLRHDHARGWTAGYIDGDRNLAELLKVSHRQVLGNIRFHALPGAPEPRCTRYARLYPRYD